MSEPSERAMEIAIAYCTIHEYGKKCGRCLSMAISLEEYAAEAVREERERCAAWALDWELRGGDDMETQSGALFHAAEGVECAGRRIGAAILSGEPAPADCVARTRATIRGQDDE